jgi:bromodomain adjacent to zinc finger domain protein 1A
MRYMNSQHASAKKEEAEREKAEQAAKEAAAKKKPIKYPTEDLDVIPTEREKKAGLKVRPVPKRDVPFGDSFEAFLMSWSYLQVFG